MLQDKNPHFCCPYVTAELLESLAQKGAFQKLSLGI